MKILILGSGGREHTLAWKLAQSPQCETLYITPGNAGTAQCGINLGFADNDMGKIKECILEKQIDILVVGPEQPLVDGIYDIIKNDPQTKHVIVIGPSQKGAMLEGSKDFAKAFMMNYHIPTAAYKTFTKETIEDAFCFIDSLPSPYVLKADGLAAGKGVLICEKAEQAKAEIREMLLSEKFGKASQKIVIEQFLKGIELSVFILTDGKNYLILPSAKDYKRIGEKDTGLNTGGMGSVSPVPFADKTFMDKVEKRIIIPTVEGLHKENIIYKGFIFIGLMNVDGNPYVIEYNVRLGDPETESVLPRIENDLIDLFVHVENQTLNEIQININPKAAATIMLVSKGYPESYEKGKIISNFDKVNNSIVFHAGTKYNNQNQVISNGGRVIAITSLGNTLEEALAVSNQNAKLIEFENKYYRTDIGRDVL